MKASRILYVVSIPLLVMMIFALGWGTARAASTNSVITPIIIDGNPTCTSQGYDHELKVDPPVSGTYSVDAYNTVTVVINDGKLVDWDSTLGMDAVIVKGSSAGNLFVYDPPAEAFSGNGLYSPVNASGGYASVSHIKFCYDYELTASKTANATYTRAYTWDITKTVDDDSHVGFPGDSFTSNYTVAVHQTVVDSNFAVSGTITVNNPTPFTVNFSVADSVGGTSATVNCPVNSLLAGASTVCTYSASLGAKVDGINTATISSLTTGVGGATASAGYTFGEPTTTVGYPTINVSDTLGGNLGSASGDDTFEYPVTFTCNGDEGENPNTATIEETGQSASENVDVACYELTVTKDADTALTRTWTWSIEKTADQTDLILSEGQLFEVNYEVEVDATSIDSAWAVSGEIEVYNPAPIDAVLTSVSDVVSPDIAGVVDCGVTFPYTLVAGGTLTCDYSATLPDASTRLNTASATISNGTSFAGTANVDFSTATVNEVDECIDVTDTNLGVLGTVCAGDALQTFTYSLWFGAHPDADVVLECGDNTPTNTASFVANDSGATGSDMWAVNAEVTCATGCTLTQGYWKTHSLHGPAPYDDAWLNLGPAGADTLFFKSNMTWYQVFWTPPAGRAYINLAHQYMAAKLNILNGASTTPEVDLAILAAEALFNAQAVGDITLDKAESKAALKHAATLDKYNNGLIGPGHCSE